MRVTIDIPLPLVLSAVESGLNAIGYWAKDARWQLYGNGRKSLSIHERDPSRIYTVGFEAFPSGIARLAAIAPIAFGDILRGMIDGPTGDLLIQAMVFGEVKYG